MGLPSPYWVQQPRAERQLGTVRQPGLRIFGFLPATDRRVNLNPRTNLSGCRELESRWSALHTGADEGQTNLPSRPALAAGCNVDGSVVRYHRCAQAQAEAAKPGSPKSIPVLPLEQS